MKERHVRFHVEFRFDIISAMEGKIVFEGKTGKNNHIVIRYPTREDAQAMCDYINILSKEQTYITFQGEQINLEDEEKYLYGQLDKIAQRQAIQLLVFSNNQLIGIAGIDMKDKVESHEGVFGISLAKDYRGEGIGKTLMRLVLEEAENNLSHLRIITLAVFSSNSLAIEMYKKFGFKEYGRLPKGILHKGEYVDHVYMYKSIK